MPHRSDMVRRTASAEPLAGSKPVEDGNGIFRAMTRLERARVIRDAVASAGETNGRWERLEFGGGDHARLWIVDGNGWEASVATAFSGLSRGAVAASYAEAVLLQQSPPKLDDVVLDVYVDGVGKVISIGTTDDVDRLIGMMPGPWEALFGLPERSWSPAVAKRLARRSA